MSQLRPSARLAPGSALPIAILLALLGLACVLAYQALDAARAEARASQRELQGYAALASVQLARRLEPAVDASVPAGLRGSAAAAAARRLLASPQGMVAIPGAAGTSHPLWVELRAPDGSPLFRSDGWEPPASLRGSWLEAKIGWYDGGSVPARAVIDTLEGALAGYTTRVAVRPGQLRSAAAPGPRSRLGLLLAAFGLTLALVGVALVQLRRQQELFRLRDDFVSGVSHELRTPLAQIRLFADLLDSGRLADAAQRTRAARVIAEESRRLTYLVDNVLHFSRGRGETALALSPRPVAPCLREAADAFSPLAAAAGVEVVLDLDAAVIAPVDRDALKQIVLNLLDNAVKYGPRGQRVVVRADRAGASLHLAVDDEGPGIPGPLRNGVWEPYRRLARDAGTAAGCGIGLSVVRDLVAQHGGSAHVKDAPGGGCRVLCVFPGATTAVRHPEPVEVG